MMGTLDWCISKQRMRQEHALPSCVKRRTQCLHAVGWGGEWSHQKPSYWNLDLRLLNAKLKEKKIPCCLSHPVCSLLLWEPKQTNTNRETVSQFIIKKKKKKKEKKRKENNELKSKRWKCLLFKMI